jgi:hypothetical protein
VPVLHKVLSVTDLYCRLARHSGLLQLLTTVTRCCLRALKSMQAVSCSFSFSCCSLDRSTDSCCCDADDSVLHQISYALHAKVDAVVTVLCEPVKCRSILTSCVCKVLSLLLCQQRSLDCMCMLHKHRQHGMLIVLRAALLLLLCALTASNRCL